jgi:hypothetical protein
VSSSQLAEIPDRCPVVRGLQHRLESFVSANPLVKKPKDLLEYGIMHEMAHLIEPTHNDRFIAILEEHLPTWRDARAELNELPLTSEVWNE